MKTMTLMAALAMVAATHSIATRTAVASDVTTTTAPAIRTFDLPAVRVHATVERETAPLAQARIHDLPPVRVQAVRDERDVADVRKTALAMRTATARRASLAIPRGSARRGLLPERVPSRADVRLDRWTALACVIRLRMTRVWPMQPCNTGAQRSRSLSGAGTSMPVSLVERRR